MNKFFYQERLQRNAGKYIYGESLDFEKIIWLIKQEKTAGKNHK